MTATWQTNPDRGCANTDPELFFLAGTVQDAKRLCRGCPVRAECLQWSLDTKDEYAVLGGTTPLERGRMRRREQRKGAAVRAGARDRETVLEDWAELSADGYNIPQAAARIDMTPAALVRALERARQAGDPRAATFSHVGVAAHRARVSA